MKTDLETAKVEHSSDDILVFAVLSLGKKIFTINCSGVHYFCQTFQVIQIETSHGSCPIRLDQPTKFAGSSGCVNCSRFGSLIF